MASSWYCSDTKPFPIYHPIRLTFTLYFTLAGRGHKLDQLIYPPLSRLGTQGVSGNTVYCLSTMNLSSWFLNVFKVGAVTICSGNPLHGEITLTEKKFFRISFLHDFFFNLRA